MGQMTEGGSIYFKMARTGPWGSRWLGLSHMLQDDLKVLLILLDGWAGCNGFDNVRRVHILLDG